MAAWYGSTSKVASLPPWSPPEPLPSNESKSSLVRLLCSGALRDARLSAFSTTRQVSILLQKTMVRSAGCKSRVLEFQCRVCPPELAVKHTLKGHLHQHE